MRRRNLLAGMAALAAAAGLPGTLTALPAPRRLVAAIADAALLQRIGVSYFNGARR